MVIKRGGGCESTKNLVAERRPVMKKKKKKKKKTRQYFKKTFGYLFSDDYMFAPLLSSSHFSSPTTSSIGIEESAKVNGDKDFVEKVGDYLKCDCYLYSPMVITQPWLNSIIVSRPDEKKDMRSKSEEDLLKELAADKTDKAAVEKTGIFSVNKEQNLKKGLPQDRDRDRSTIIKRSRRVHRETVKHIIFQNCLLCP